jgi:hypothetical protein
MYFRPDAYHCAFAYYQPTHFDRNAAGLRVAALLAGLRSGASSLYWLPRYPPAAGNYSRR